MASFNLPPRQKMINLIYVVLLAMMAINVSSDVMQGFTVLTLNSQEQNRTLREMNERLTALCRQSGIDGLPAKADSIAALQKSSKKLSRRSFGRSRSSSSSTTAKKPKETKVKTSTPSRSSSGTYSVRRQRR